MKWRDSGLQRTGLTCATLLALGGCASYTPRPLATPEQALAAPDLAVLSIDAAKIDRPFLKPTTVDFSRPLTADEIALIAVVASPDLKALRAKNGVAGAQAFAARLLPDPTVQGGFDKLLSGPDDMNGYAGQLGLDIGQLRLSHVIRQQNAANIAQVRLDVAWAEWQTAGQARLQAVRILALQDQLVIARQSAAAAERLFQAALAATGRGDIAATELETRRQAVLDLTDKAQTADRDLLTARGELNRLLGLPPETVLRLAPPPEPPAPPPAPALLAKALDRRLDLGALRAGYASSEADVHTAVLMQFPTLSLTLATARDTSDNHVLGPQIGFTLPLWNRNRGGIATAQATRAQLRLEYEARLTQTRADIDAAVTALQHIRTQRAIVQAAIPALARAADAAARAARHGDLSAATADTTLQALRDRQLALLVLDQQAAEQSIALELLVGSTSEGWTQ